MEGSTISQILTHFVAISNLVCGVQLILLGIELILIINTSLVYTILLMVVGVCLIICGLILLLGVIKGNYIYVKVYLFLSTPCVLVLNIVYLCLTIKGYGYHQSVTALIFTVINMILVSVFAWLLQYNLYSFYKKLVHQGSNSELHYILNSDVSNA